MPSHRLRSSDCDEKIVGEILSFHDVQTSLVQEKQEVLPVKMMQMKRVIDDTYLSLDPRIQLSESL
jgi:hypothetical protein